MRSLADMENILLRAGPRTVDEHSSVTNCYPIYLVASPHSRLYVASHR